MPEQGRVKAHHGALSRLLSICGRGHRRRGYRVKHRRINHLLYSEGDRHLDIFVEPLVDPLYDFVAYLRDVVAWQDGSSVTDEDRRRIQANVDSWGKSRWPGKLRFDWE